MTLVDGQNYYLQDATGAICLRLAAKTDEIALGDTIIGTGKRAEFRGMAQLGSGHLRQVQRPDPERQAPPPSPP